MMAQASSRERNRAKSRSREYHTAPSRKRSGRGQMIRGKTSRRRQVEAGRRRTSGASKTRSATLRLVSQRRTSSPVGPWVGRSSIRTITQLSNQARHRTQHPRKGTRLLKLSQSPILNHSSTKSVARTSPRSRCPSPTSPSRSL